MKELDQIEYYAEGVKLQADYVATHTRNLTYRVPFETKMEASLNSAEAALLRALQIIRATRLHYERQEAA